MDRTPEEIKKGLECCSTGCADDCFDCPYGDAEVGRIDDHCIEQLLRESIARNQQLEKRIIHVEALNQQNLSVITMQERTRARLEERISQLEAQVPRWIPLEGEPPDGEVLAANFAPNTYGYNGYIIGLVLEEDGKFYAANDFEYLNNVTHWMPLPEALKEEHE